MEIKEEKIKRAARAELHPESWIPPTEAVQFL
jgi:hypothetical protein